MLVSAKCLQIVGGTYVETCAEPHWNQLYGSGLRAAAAVSALGCEVALSTYIDAVDSEDLTAYAAAFGVRVIAARVEQTLRFAYQHPLARPEISPSLHLIGQATALAIEAPAILRFGMLEGTGVVTGGNVVYDPQSSFAPEPFHANGSRAERLAIVANESESLRLSEASSPLDAGSRLLSSSGAAVVVIKHGARGLTLFTLDPTNGIAVESLPAFETRSVFPIGSGDVFSAVFAHGWAIENLSATHAAERASRASAYYCASRALPIRVDPQEVSEALGYDLVALRVPTSGDRPLVYLAGPFFTMAQRWLVQEARAALLGQGVEVFSPFHDVGHGAAEDVVPKDICELDRCRAVLSIVDGADAGTLFEIGYARAKGIPVIALCQAEAEEPLKMLRGTGCEIQADFSTAVYRASWAAMGATAMSSAPSSRRQFITQR